jgi:nucleotide-binding universal stress UspA family protein
MTGRTARPVVVGIDGSADARRAMFLAADLANERGAELVIVHAVGLTDVVDGEHVIAERHHTEIAEQFGEWCEAVRSTGVDEWTPVLRQGNPVDTLLATARERDAALIVVGRQGSGQRPALLLGSTAHQVAERATCPVLIVPPVGHASVPPAG